MMICDRCGKREATVHIRREGSGKSSLCAGCARDQGISAEDGCLRISLEDLFSPPQGDADRPGQRSTCPVCGIRIEEVQKSGRVGCPDCLSAFRTELVSYLQKRGRRGPYRGRAPRRHATSDGAAGPGRADAPPSARRQLECRLREALDAEDYELAARLRDMLRAARSLSP